MNCQQHQPESGTSTNVKSDLTVNYNPSAGVVLGDGANHPMTAGPITLSPGQATIVYVMGAGNIAPIDGGNTGLQNHRTYEN